jgi:hypothetical protein
VADWTNETNHQVWWVTSTNWLCLVMKTPPTYREIENKLIELEKEHKILGERYDSLVKLIRKQGKDSVQCTVHKVL